MLSLAISVGLAFAVRPHTLLQQADYWVPVLLGLYWLLLLRIVRHLHELYRSSIDLSYHNARLIYSLQEQTRVAQEASRFKDRFLAGAAHDLKQPVSALSIYAEWLSSEPELVDELGPKILQSTRAINALFDSLFDLVKLDAGRWYHVAVTFESGSVKVYLDGVEKCSGNVGTSSVNFGVKHSDESDGKPRCFWIGYSYASDRYFDGQISEVRIWNKALTPEEINAPDHFYQVAAASDGLVAYWKFDEGAGKTIKDQTSYGNDLTVEKELKWVNVSLPELGK